MSKVEMLNLKPTKVKGKELRRIALKNVHFFYAKLKNPALKQKTKFDPSRPMKNRQWEVQVLIDKATQKALKKMYSGKLAFREVEADEFEERYKVAPPFEAEEYYLISLVRHAAFPDGQFYGPAHGIDVMVREGKKAVKVNYLKLKATTTDKGFFDGEVPDLDIGNGSMGTIVLQDYWYSDDDKKVNKPVPTTLVIDNLIEYAPQEQGMDEEDLAALGIDEVDSSYEVSEATSTFSQNEDGDDEDYDDEDTESDDDDDEDDDWRTE